MGGATLHNTFGRCWRRISIHAPRGGSDRSMAKSASTVVDFNPRSPWGERRHCDSKYQPPIKFQSTLPVGGATLLSPTSAMSVFYFNPRSPWGERPAGPVDVTDGTLISIHAPRGGSDDKTLGRGPWHTISIHAPRGGSDFPFFLLCTGMRISIHAPRGGSDYSL